MSEFRIVCRRQLRQPAFALTVACTLALTVGATTAVLAVVNSVLVRALPYASPESLVWVASVRPDSPNAPFSLPELMDYRGRTRTLSGLAAYANWSASLAGNGITERLQGARMSANAFDVLGMSPAAGRLLHERDDRVDAPAVVVLSHRLWQRQYGGATDIIGKTARINGEPFVIVGVLPARFPLPLRGIDVVTPLVPDRDPLRHVRNSVNFLRFFGRLNPGIDVRAAQAELTAICQSLRQQFPVEYAGKESVRVDPLHEVLVADFRQSMLVLFVAVVVVLATALANLVSLALVKANGRRGELTVRLALGASRAQLARPLTIEAVVLAVVGSLLGWIVATQAVSIAVRWAPTSIPRLNEVSLDATAALFVAAVTAVVTVLLACAPLSVIARIRAGDALQMAARGAIGDRWNQRVRSAMVAAEISASLLLLLATIVLVQHLLRLQNLQPGFSPDGVFQARVSIPPTGYRSPEDVSRFYDRLLERLAASPSVARVGVISSAPLSGLLRTVPFSVAGQTFDQDRLPSANFRTISPAYPMVVGTRLVSGRLFSENDRADTPPVALVSAALADRFLSGNALGARLMINDNNHGPRLVEIVGVLEDVRHTALDVSPAFDVYIPLRQLHPDGLRLIRDNQFWMVKTDSEPASFRATFLRQLRAVDPDAAVSDTGTMRQFVDASLGPRRFVLGLFVAFSLTAVLLAVLGLYGLVSYAVSQRAAEIGLRMAIGATQGDVQSMILRQAARLGVAGAVMGVVGTMVARQLASRIAQDVSLSPVLIAATAASLVGVVLVAAWVPARRAARVDPTLAIKAQ